jgi:SAM-dependent methyltransferase
MPGGRYSLTLTDDERARYRMMARGAADNESSEWSAAGVVEGARVADVGCGPGAVTRVLAEWVGPEGSVTGVDADPVAVAYAREEVEDCPQADVLVGQADATGLEPGRHDVVMCRHVLAHNGGREEQIVAHLASLVRPGGSVYLVDIVVAALLITALDDDLRDLLDRYRDLHQARGNDLSIGLRLGDLLLGAGLTLERFACRAPVIRLMAGMRPPAWAATGEMVAEGIATDADVERWAQAFARLDAAETRPWLFPGAFVAIGRRR